jgi:hypothetical protein
MSSTFAESTFSKTAVLRGDCQLLLPTSCDVDHFVTDKEKYVQTRFDTHKIGAQIIALRYCIDKTINQSILILLQIYYRHLMM